jgi:hypothetical protein
MRSAGPANRLRERKGLAPAGRPAGVFFMYTYCWFPSGLFCFTIGSMRQVPIYTIGYGAREIDELVAVLRAFDIAYLIDIRSRPYSRFKPDFSQKALAGQLEEAGIRYLFMGDTLGGQPDAPDCYVDGKVDYEKVAQQPFYQAGIARISEAFRQQRPVVLMCSEGRPEQCHRSKLIGRTLVREGIAVVHIDENDQLISQEEVLLRLNKGQPSLFGEDFQRFTSRKKYQPGETDDD